MLAVLPQSSEGEGSLPTGPSLDPKLSKNTGVWKEGTPFQ